MRGIALGRHQEGALARVYFREPAHLSAERLMGRVLTWAAKQSRSPGSALPFVCLLRDRGRLDLAEGAWPVLVMLRGAWPVRTSHRAGAEREHSHAFNANRRAHLPAGVLIGRRESGGSRGFVSLLSLWSRQVACRDGVSMVPHP